MKKCFRCPATENLSNDHIIPKRFGTTLSGKNKMILCRPCHDWKEKHTLSIYKDGEIIGIYNPILKRKMLFSLYEKHFKNGVRKNGKITVIKKQKKEDTHSQVAFNIINNTIEYRGSLERAKQILKETFKP